MITTITHGAFTFVHQPGEAEETWSVQLPEGLIDTRMRFCVKNFGGAPSTNPGNPYTGWRVAAGGPFFAAGGWATRDEAIRGAVPWLQEWYRTHEHLIMSEAVQA